jgi:hypothetical protein
VQQGKAKVTDPAEQAALGRFCRQHKDRPRAAVRFYRDAFAGDPKLAEDLPAGHRFAAACAAVRAAAGKGEDAAGSDAGELAQLRRQSQAWLKADLSAWEKQLGGGGKEGGEAVRDALAGWLRDRDLAGVRGEALAPLPADERLAWQQFWADVEALRGRARGPKKQ